MSIATEAARENSAPTVRIEPVQGWQLLNLRELREYKDLAVFLTLRDIKVVYEQTVLGLAWAVIRPLVQVLIFTVVFGNLAGLSSDGVPYILFSFAALAPWSYFSSALQQAIGSVVTRKDMLTKVYFPRLIIPLTPVLGRLIDLGVSLAVLTALMIYFGRVPTLGVLMVPVLILITMISALGLGMFLAALTVQYRDIKFAATFMVQLMMYAAPVVWSLSLVYDKLGETAVRIYAIFPMVGVIQGFRAALLGTVPMPWDLIGIGTVSAVTMLIVGAFFFRRMERRFADVA